MEGFEVLPLTYTPRQKKKVRDEEKGGGRSVCERGNSGRRVERRRVRRGVKRACEWVCMNDVRVQSIQDIEPTTDQMTCGTKVNKMVKCVFLPQSICTRRFDSPCRTPKHKVRTSSHDKSASVFGEGGRGLRGRRGKEKLPCSREEVRW